MWSARSQPALNEVSHDAVEKPQLQYPTYLASEIRMIPFDQP